MKDQNTEPTSIEPVEPTSRKGSFSKTLKRILVIAGFILIGVVVGAVLVYFLAVRPLNQQVAGLNANFNSLNAELSANKAASIQKGEALTVCNKELANANTEITLANKVGYASQLMYELSSVQQALLSNDLNTAGTRLSLAKTYMSKLTPLITDATDLNGLTVPLEDALTLYRAKPNDAVAKLDVLIKTLHQLIESLQVK